MRWDVLFMSKKRPAWKAAEELVAAIEKSLAPEARVEHDVQLPVLGQDRFRQCDVVIRMGRLPREQIFIVEVQKRKEKPDINTFGGWLRKMEEVGASGLICVSEAGYPDSIIQDVARRVGPKVRLVTLDPMTGRPQGMPIHLVPEIIRSTYKIRNVDVAGVKVYRVPGEEARDDAITHVSYLKNAALSHDKSRTSAGPLSAVIQAGLKINDPYSGDSGTKIGDVIAVNFTMKASDELPLWFHADQGSFRINEISVKADVQRIDFSEPIMISNWIYKQEFHDEAIAWVATSSFDVEGETMEMKLIFLPDENGFLAPAFDLELSGKFHFEGLGSCNIS